MSGRKNSSLFMEVFDVLFVMILCFATLLTTMLMQGGVLVGGSTTGIHYTFRLGTMLILIAGFIAYLLYVIPKSDSELRIMIRQIYGEDGDVSPVPETDRKD